MPYHSVYELPDVFLEHKGVKVYHAYHDGDLDYKSNHCFSTTINGADDEANEGRFDVRELPGYQVVRPPVSNGVGDTEVNQMWDEFRDNRVEEKEAIRVIIAAIDSGLLKGSDEEDFTS